MKEIRSVYLCGEEVFFQSTTEASLTKRANEKRAGKMGWRAEVGGDRGVLAFALGEMESLDEFEQITDIV